MTSPSNDHFDQIRIRGATTHNLKSVDVDIPLDKLTVISGVSGSGKSSLAFDTLFAEGQRRYLATVSATTRSLLQRMGRPAVESIDGLPPTLGIGQRTRGPQQRSTVATIAEVYDYLRVLFARAGRLHCPVCQTAVTSQSREAIVGQAMTGNEGRKVLVLAPLVRAEKGAHAEVFPRVVRDGFVRARVDGDLIEAATPPALSPSKPHDIEIVIDRLIVKPGIEERLGESIDLALELGQGQCLLSHDAGGVWHDRLYSSRLACTQCGTSFPALEPTDFSFHSPRGRCSSCEGLGTQKEEVDVSSSTPRVCSACHGGRLGDLPRAVLIRGRSITSFVSQVPSAALAVIDAWSCEFGQPTSGAAADSAGDEQGSTATTTDPNDEFIALERLAAQHILPEIAARLRFLIDVGLDYLTLDRSGETLSSGEYQRARLAASLGSALSGVCYVVDEPTSGLHPRETERLWGALAALRERGNTVVLVEHDLDVVQRADRVIDLGPGAGLHGGRLIAQGTPDEIRNTPDSVTGRELARRANRTTKDVIQSFQPSGELVLAGATLHHLRDVTLRVPLGGLICVTGVSGSGKSTLIMETLVPAIRSGLSRLPRNAGPSRIVSNEKETPFRELIGIEQLGRLVPIDQSPLGRSARSTPATYSGVWDDVRQVFAKTKAARLLGFRPARFSPQHPEGRCGRCRGRGTLNLDERRMIDWSIPCPDCDGTRFNPQTLSVRYRGLNVADVLRMSFEEAATFFENLPRLARPLALFRDLGLGYLKLGQPADTLSGGEAQRVKLATELVTSHESAATLFVLDEPTSGLHAKDVGQLTDVLRRLVTAGHSVLVIEHNLELISTADWIIDIGPEAGPDGGRIVAEGPVSLVAKSPHSHTGHALRQYFG